MGVDEGVCAAALRQHLLQLEIHLLYLLLHVRDFLLAWLDLSLQLLYLVVQHELELLQLLVFTTHGGFDMYVVHVCNVM